MKACEIGVAFNRLLIKVILPRSQSIEELRIVDGNGYVLSSVAGSDSTDEALKRYRVYSGPDVSVTFVSQASLHTNDITRLLKSDCKISITTSDGKKEVIRTPEALSLLQFLGLGQKILHDFAKFSDVGPLVSSIVSYGLPDKSNSQFFVDYFHRFEESAFINGWMLDFDPEATYILLCGCALFTSLANSLRHSRPDVSKHFRLLGVGVTKERHGFSFTFDVPELANSFDVFSIKDGRPSLNFSGMPEVKQDRQRIFDIIYGEKATCDESGIRHLADMVTPFLRPRERDLQYEVVQRSTWPENVLPDLSIIVPFYREWRFMFSVLSMVRRSPKTWEWVVVCDDPEIFQGLFGYCSSQELEVRQRMSIVLTHGDTGFGNANNIGSQVARSKHLLLMNSDIWIEDFTAILGAVQYIDNQAYSIIGFSLLFQDRTIQHAGMSFERSSLMNNLFVALHARKGLPFSVPAHEEDIVSVDGVTGALMLIAKARFEELGGFDDRYVGGDFEDAALCCACRADGGKIGMALSGQIFHLERQSIKLEAETALIGLRTLANCVRFNNDWASAIVDASSGK